MLTIPSILCLKVNGGVILFFRLIILLMIPWFADGVAKEPALDAKVKYIKNNDAVKDLLFEQVQKETETIKKNRILLHNREIALSDAIESGIVDREKCIRQSISALRTINHVYSWMLNQVETMNYEETRLSTIESVDRIKYINRLFMDINYRIDDCYLKNIKVTIAGSNEITKYAVDNRSDVIKQGLSVPEEFQAARSPFR